jgi:DNA-binding NtrC family response regulator
MPRILIVDGDAAIAALSAGEPAGPLLLDIAMPGRYREGLYYRLNVLPFRIPSLRERSEDIPMLARAFVAEFCARAGVQCKQLTQRALAQFRSHSWPGNGREHGGNISRTAEAIGLARESHSRKIKSLALEVERG